MSENYKILIVDDEPLNFDLMKLALKDAFDLSYVESGEECLRFVKEHNPDIILLDIQMPGMDGYETCRALKTEQATNNLPVIFVSGLDSIEERLAGYDAGGDDYIIKPFQAQELLSKVRIALSNKTEKERLQQDASTAMDTAMQAITSTGELGIVLSFLSTSFNCDDYQSIADEAANSMSNYGLRTTVQVRIGRNVYESDSSGVIRPLETALLTKLKDQGRIYDFDARSIFNFDHISVLVKNMPLDEPDKYGRFKDNLALLVEGAEARIRTIIAEKNVTVQKQALMRMIERTQSALEVINAKHQDHKIKNTHIMETLLNDVEDSFISLGLTEEQEEAFLSMVNDATNKTIALFDEGLEVDDQLNGLMEELNKVIDRKNPDDKVA
jgi:DNA-binding response OmpR family regulator